MTLLCSPRSCMIRDRGSELLDRMRRKIKRKLLCTEIGGNNSYAYSMSVEGIKGQVEAAG